MHIHAKKGTNNCVFLHFATYHITACHASGRKLAARNFTNVVALSQPLNEGNVLKLVVDESERAYISSAHNIGNVEYNSLTISQQLRL